MHEFEWLCVNCADRKSGPYPSCDCAKPRIVRLGEDAVKKLDGNPSPKKRRAVKKLETKG